MGVPQTVVSRLERQHDMLLSTLTEYLKAAGDHPRVVVTINGQGGGPAAGRRLDIKEVSPSTVVVGPL
jgi:hypothetical protein